MNKETFIINIHSFVDVITNSSTELFMLDTEKSIEVVQSIISEMEQKYPSEYGYKTHVGIADEWEVKEAFGYVNEEEAIEYLKAMGYKIIPPLTKPEPQYITISCERGCINPNLIYFIEQTFNVVFHSTEM